MPQLKNYEGEVKDDFLSNRNHHLGKRLRNPRHCHDDRRRIPLNILRSHNWEKFGAVGQTFMGIPFQQLRRFILENLIDDEEFYDCSATLGTAD